MDNNKRKRSEISSTRELQTSVNKAKAQTTQKQKKKKKKEQLSNTNFDCIEEHDTEELKCQA